MRCPRVPLFLLALGGAGAACAGAPQSAPHPQVRSDDRGPATPELPPPPSPARWVDSSGATAIGPAVDGGTLVLLGGRRALVAADGSVRTETAPCPEPIHELAEVPSATQAGKRYLVGRGVEGVYRFDDPLGAPTTLARARVELTRIGGAPGLVAVWDTASDLPRFLDVETGQPKAMPGLPAPPLRAVTFRDAKEGAAVFEAAGLAVTADGGATWRLASEAVAGDALRASGVRLRGGALRAFAHADKRDAPIDVALARLGPADEAPPPEGEAPLLRWIRVTGRDPLEAAIVSGAPIRAGAGAARSPRREGGEALVASHGLLARVDLQTGAVLEIAEFARGSGVDVCSVGESELFLWIACALSEDTSSDLYDPFGVLRVPLGASTLDPGRPVLRRNGEAELRTSPSGGAMLLGACSAGDEGVACVRQPSGKWVTLRTTTELLDRGAGPLADGQVVFLRGLWEGDEPAPEGGKEGAEGEEGEEAGAAKRPHVVILAESGKERRGPGFDWPGNAPADLRVVSPMEEGDDHALSFVVADDTELAAVVQPLGGEPASARRLAGATHARIHSGHGIAVGEGLLLASVDGGRGWAPVAAPPRVTEALDHAGALLDEPGALAVNALGIKVDTQLRIGWGPAAPEDAGPKDAGSSEAPPAGAPLPPRTPPTPAGQEQALVCVTQSTGAGTPPLAGAHEVIPLLTRGDQPVPKGHERKVAPASAGRWGMLDAVGLLEEQGPPVTPTPGARVDLAAGPTTWTLRWLDPAEIQGKPRSWSGPAPKGVGWGASVRQVSAQGARALFTIRASSKILVVRLKASGRIETAELAWDLLPGTEVVFGEGRGEPIAWLHDTALVVWVSGEAPRVVATVATHAMRTLGQPNQGGVPILLSSTDWALARTLPIPPLPKTPAAAQGGPTRGASAPGPAAPPIPLDGWTPAPNLRVELTRLPACGPHPKGDRYLLLRATGDASVDGYREVAQGVLYDVRMVSGEACVASIAALLSPASPAPAASSPKDASVGGPVAFVRVDLAGRRAEGGDRGLEPQAAVRRLSCVLSPRR